MSLPAPSPKQPFCQVSALVAGHVKAPLAWVLEGVSDDVTIDVPALSFLVRHPSSEETLLFDLGIRKDWDTGLPPNLVRYTTEKLTFKITVPEDISDALAKGGSSPADVKRILVSHLHFDHIGDAALFPHAQFLAGAGARPLVENGYPKNPESPISADTLPEGRTTYLDPAEWPELGPFPHALDLYGDGSVYVVDAGQGHMPGHLNLLVRTSADGGWLYLAGDSAHDWSLLTGEGKIGRHAHFGCAHLDVAAAEAHIERLRTLMKENPRVRVLLAHDRPWFEKNKGGSAFWPGVIESL